MEQKGYINNEKYEIIIELLGGESHVRGIAKKTDINHMSVSRKLSELANENAIDFKIMGRNKVYYIKNTSEARSYIMMSENYKLNKILNIYPNLRIIINKVIDDSRIKMALFFGSYAKFTAKKDSDIDIFVEGNDRIIRNDLELINSKLSIKIGNYDPDNNLIKEIDKNHVIIKGIEEYYEKRKFFKKAGR